MSDEMLEAFEIFMRSIAPHDYNASIADARHIWEHAWRAAALSQKAEAPAPALRGIGSLRSIEFDADVIVNGELIRAGTVWSFAAPKAAP